ncbi:MAG: hypothetical protein J3Q66DRAFT_335081 [Benniella sp.]|nr:MAG: hypothetical protein J3Q66DRAFT_335081 [Benniella sp.]
MAKKMQRLEASADFRPFKFRIQAFTNAFHDSLIANGLTEDILPLRKVKVYLWKHKHISRFNEDGKKQKSKGNHVWSIEARKSVGPLSNNGEPVASAGAEKQSSSSSSSSAPFRWQFREFKSRIAGPVMKFARVGFPYVYAPKIWDPQMSNPDETYDSPWLPPWLKWKNGKELCGTPGPEDKSCEITVIATYINDEGEQKLEMTFPLTVSDPSKEEFMDSANENDNEQGEDDYNGQGELD